MTIATPQLVIQQASGTRLFRSVILAALAGTILVRTANNTVDLDIWHEMALARSIVSSGTVPTRDQFAYTPTITPFVHHEWGAGMLAYLLSVLFGPHGILALKYALLGGALAFCLSCARRGGRDLEHWAYLGVPALWLLASGYLPVRAQAYTFLFVGLLLWCLQRDDEGHRRWILVFLPLFPVWVNLHAGCAVGIVIVGVCWCERLMYGKLHLHLLAIAAAMLLLLLLTPYGTAYPRYLWRALVMARPQITEWAPMWTADRAALTAYVLCAMLTLYITVDAAVRRSERPSGIAIVLFTATIAALHVKMAPIFAVASLCYLPALLRRTPLGARLSVFNKEWRDLAVATWLVWLLTITYAAIAIGTRPWKLTVPGETKPGGKSLILYPVGAVDYLREHSFTGNLMTPFPSGAYVTWKLAPAVRVSLDGRYEVAYPQYLFQRILDFYAARPGWKATLAAYPTDAVLLPANTPLAAVMPESAWKKVYSDSQYQVYARPGLSLPIVNRGGQVPDGTFP